MRTHTQKDIAFRVRDDFPERLKSVVRGSGETVINFSGSIGHDRKALYSWMDGRQVPNADALYTICRLYNVSADWLLGLDGA